LGPALTDGTVVTGDSVHVAARVARAAEPGGVCLTRQAFLEFGPALRLLCRPVGTRDLKGVAQPVDLLELDWRDPAAFPRRVLIEETGREIALPQQDIVSFGRLHEPDGPRSNDIVLSHPDPARTRQISRWHFELRRAPDGLHLRTLSDGLTTVDGQPVSRGADIPVRSGTRIGVADTLNLRLTGATHAATDADENTTLKRPAAPR
jgi:hypothetical protein